MSHEFRFSSASSAFAPSLRRTLRTSTSDSIIWWGWGPSWFLTGDSSTLETAFYQLLTLSLNLQQSPIQPPPCHHRGRRLQLKGNVFGLRQRRAFLLPWPTVPAILSTETNACRWGMVDYIERWISVFCLGWTKPRRRLSWTLRMTCESSTFNCTFLWTAFYLSINLMWWALVLKYFSLHYIISILLLTSWRHFLFVYFWFSLFFSSICPIVLHVTSVFHQTTYLTVSFS